MVLPLNNVIVVCSKVKCVSCCPLVFIKFIRRAPSGLFNIRYFNTISNFVYATHTHARLTLSERSERNNVWRKMDLAFNFVSIFTYYVTLRLSLVKRQPGCARGVIGLDGCFTCSRFLLCVSCFNQLFYVQITVVLLITRLMLLMWADGEWTGQLRSNTYEVV